MQDKEGLTVDVAANSRLVKLCVLSYFRLDVVLRLLNRGILDHDVKDFNATMQKVHANPEFVIPSHKKIDSDAWIASQVSITSRTYTYIIYEKASETLYIVPRPTGTLANWRTNADIKQIPFYDFDKKATRIHTGFHRHYHESHQHVEANVDAVVKSVKVSHLVFTGMSLGGALTQLYYISLEVARPKLLKTMSSIRIITFGAPRVGDQHFCDMMNTMSQAHTFIQFQNKYDIVPRLPKSDYMHAGKCIVLPSQCVDSHRAYFGVSFLLYTL